MEVEEVTEVVQDVADEVEVVVARVISRACRKVARIVARIIILPKVAGSDKSIKPSRTTNSNPTSVLVIAMMTRLSATSVEKLATCAKTAS